MRNITPHSIRILSIYLILAWLQGTVNATEVIFYDINTNVSQSLAGPVPPTFHLELGSRFAVWSSFDGTHTTLVHRWCVLKLITTALASVNGDRIAWESDSNGNFDVFVMI